ncbi:MAG: two-component system, OmpR family, alkaline phosphatase synthesis response regulator PhoP [Actinomycetota bacterium]|nr:two-component system, OmpR family, alkaline phosphatase synthesis response regulator PhoP [Actinomycetota bacterium]
MKTVLVVDDDPDIRELVTWKLAQAGYATMSEADGEAALVAVASSAIGGRPIPDLILVDWMMPRITGIDVCRALRDNPLTAHIPIILLTAKAQQAEIQCGYAAGVDDYIVKPFSPQAMVTRIEAVLARRQAR